MIRIRKGRLSDVEGIVEFQMLMARETEGLELDREAVRAGVQGVFERPERGSYLVAEGEGKLAGSLLMTPEWSDWRGKTMIWFHSLYVLPEVRGQGVFKQMYAYLKQMAEDDESLAGLRLYADKSNRQAQEIYEKLGMNKEHYHLYEWLKA